MFVTTVVGRHVAVETCAEFAETAGLSLLLRMEFYVAFAGATSAICNEGGH